MSTRFALALGGLLCLASAASSAAVPRYMPANVASAKALMLSGRSQEARSLLQGLAREHPADNDIAFLLGMLALRAGDYREAIGDFRSILVREPAALRVRLELGRAFYFSRDYENAYRQFQFARAGKLPPGVSASIDRFVAAIRREKSWSYSLGVAIAPDTNINNGTSSRETEIFGLPFELSNDTRRRSGTGLNITASGEFAPRITETVRLRMGGSVERREYKAHDFDDMTMSAYVGPRIVLSNWDLSVLATGFRRTFGGRRLSQGAGARIEAIHGFGARTAISLGLSAQQVSYPHYPLQDGRSYSVALGVIHSLTPASFLNARLGASRHAAQTPELASWSGWLSAGYYRDLPGGFSIYVEPSYALSRYDAADPFFGKRRNDRLLQLQLAVLNRRIVMSRFTPRIALTVARRYSTINLYEFTQRRLEIGFTSSF
jgi:tetratricopeptide (TPR) repeat protein